MSLRCVRLPRWADPQRLAYAVLLRELGATRAGLVMYLSPLYAAGMAWWVLGEVPQGYHFVGALLILPSIFLAPRAPRH